MSTFKVVEVDSDPHSRREAGIYTAAFAKEGVTADTFFMFIDLDGANFPHTPGTKPWFTSIFGRAIKDNAGAKWAVNLAVITRIDGTDADLILFPAASIFLRDTSQLSSEAKATVLDFPISAEVFSGDLVRGVNNLRRLNVAAVNTGITLEDANGDNPTPAVGDIIVRAELISGGGILDFAISAQYFMET